MMSRFMRTSLKILGWGVCVVVGVALGTAGVARVIAGRKYNHRWKTHEVSFPIPFPLSAA